MGLRFLGLWLTALMAVACVQAPDVPDPGMATDPMEVYADVLLNYNQGGQVQVCLDGLPPCEEPLGDPCGPPEVLGEPDGVAYTFDVDGRVDVGVHCGAIIGPITIHASVPEDHTARVYGSYDGLRYELMGVLSDDEDNRMFGIDEVGLSSIRYVRIGDTGGGGIAIDAIEGPWNGDAP